jgi:hypothetical protein
MQQIDRFLYTCENPNSVSQLEEILAAKQYSYAYAECIDDQLYISKYLMKLYIYLYHNFILPIDKSAFFKTGILKRHYRKRYLKYKILIDGNLNLFSKPLPLYFNYTSPEKWSLEKFRTVQHKYRITPSDYEELNLFLSDETSPQGIKTYKNLSEMSRYLNFAYLECSLFEKLIPLLRQNIHRFVYYYINNQEKISFYQKTIKSEFFILKDNTKKKRLNTIKLLEYLLIYLDDQQINSMIRESINQKINCFLRKI